jgi:hypothetical protein
MKLNMNDQDFATVGDSDDISQDDVLQMIAQSEEVSNLILSIENLCVNGDKLDEIAGNIYGVATMLEKEALTKASFEFLNADGALNVLVGRQLEFTEATRQAITTEAMDGLKAGMSKGWEAVKRWFAALWDWLKQLFRKTVELFVSNDKVLTALIKDVKGGKLHAKVEDKHTGVPVVQLEELLKKAEGKLNALATAEKFTAEELSLSASAVEGLIAASKSDVSIGTLGWNDKDKVLACLGQAKTIAAEIKKHRSTAEAKIKKEEDKAIAAAKKNESKADEAGKKAIAEEIAAARTQASLQAKALALHIRLAKFAVSAAIQMGRVWRGK